MKTKSLIGILLLIFVAAPLAGATRYALPRTISAEVYPKHVEINFENRHGFIYDILVSVDEGRTFIKRGETNNDYYLDFWNNYPTTKAIIYRVVSQGLSPNSEAASKSQVVVTIKKFTDDDLLDMVQKYTTRYFYDFSHPDCGMARERNNNPKGDIVTTGGTGMGIMALVAGIKRGYFPREKAITKMEQIISFLERVERFKGAWAHWYNGNTGKVFSFSEFDDGGDIVETAFLTQGLLTAREFMKSGNISEKALAERITKMWKEIDWNWYTQGTDSLYWHWSKNYGFKMNHRIKGFDETLITYVLAASSPTYPIRPSVYHACYTESAYFKNDKSYFGIPLSLGMEYGGPLFFTHYSFLGLNPTNLVDRYADYWERNRAHVLIHREYAIQNPKKHKGLGANFWGFTSSDDALLGYTSHHPGTNDENGTVSPTAAVSSIPYTPAYSMEVIKHLYFDLGNQTFGRYGFYDAVNLTLPVGQQVVRSYLAIDQGPIAVMIENYRSGFIWKLFAENKEIGNGLKALGFYYKRLNY